MKLLVSAKLLKAKLNELDLENETVERVTLDNDELILITQTSSAKLYVHCVEFNSSLKQEGRRWNDIKKLVSKLEDQPVVLHIYESIVNLTLQF